MATFREIEIFLKLAEELHFGKTALLLGITQAALSKEIGKLESSLDCRLFDRSDKWNIRLTAAGKAYYDAIKGLPELLRKADEHARRAARGEHGMLTISVANMVYDHLQFGGILQKMHEKYPAVKLLVRDSQNSPQVYGQILSGEVDIGFLAVNNLGNPEQNLQQLKLLELPISFAIPATHPLAQKEDLKITDFKNANFILPSARYVPWLRKQFEDFFFQHCSRLPIVEQEALGLRATRQLVSAGLGIGLVVKPGTVDERENIVYREVDLMIKRIIIAAWDENNQSRTLKNFLKMLKKGTKRCD
ncbi:MAG: LysR family transcriptional regulator [Lentisphaeria bacterium]|nr:LysR family transcriptional regulator [Lentisphaeria bacterium]